MVVCSNGRGGTASRNWSRHAEVGARFITGSVADGYRCMGNTSYEAVSKILFEFIIWVAVAPSRMGGGVQLRAITTRHRIGDVLQLEIA